ncbi:hypothetical protein SEA_EASTWEST_42 [Arthrobacter phage EastWest]|uniref:Uncharacterized protein n=1 Tax=Arthrobacter phage EastWest TaxID=2894292 RepID=A0AAE8YK41_9CAUD|nr:hypothetical protein SEA_EASTWEST_42 [Arthrobacter phage EastWest]
MSRTPFEKRREQCSKSVGSSVENSVQNTLRNSVRDAFRTPFRTPSEKRLEQQTTDNKQQTTINHQLDNLRHRHLSDKGRALSDRERSKMHRISKDEAIAITKLAVTLQPGWDTSTFMSTLAGVRDQPDIAAFIEQVTRAAVDGLMIEDALREVVPHACPVTAQQCDHGDVDAQWLNGAPASVNVVNDTNDVSQSRLLGKSRFERPEHEITRPPSDDPMHWRNRFSHFIEKGARQRAEDLQKLRAEQLPAHAAVPQSATAAVADHQSVPDPAGTLPELYQTAPNQLGANYFHDPEEYDEP